MGQDFGVKAPLPSLPFPWRVQLVEHHLLLVGKPGPVLLAAAVLMFTVLAVGIGSNWACDVIDASKAASNPQQVRQASISMIHSRYQLRRSRNKLNPKP